VGSPCRVDFDWLIGFWVMTKETTVMKAMKWFGAAMVMGMVGVLPVGTINAEAQTKDKTRIGNFTYSRDYDPMTRTENPDVSARSEDGNRVLMFWCSKSGELSVAFSWMKYFATSGEITVQYRFSTSTEPVSESWSMGPNNHSGAFPRGRQGDRFVSQAVSNASVMIRVRDTDMETITAEFSLDGLRAALNTLPCATK
jgi:hypothetical protein